MDGRSWEGRERELVMDRYREVRHATEELASLLTPEDQQLQSMPLCSPTKWHRAHASWFFETFLLAPHGVPAFDPDYGYLFNSYYEALGPRHPRPKRGLLSRPSAAEISAYRAAVDARILDLLGSVDDGRFAEVKPVVELGLAHEEQHQELILTDILHAFGQHPHRPAYSPEPRALLGERSGASELATVEFEGGLVEIGARAEDGFAFDNELPRHRVWLEPFALGDRLLTIGEMRAFVAEGGYQAPALWLADGWDWVVRERVEAPLYVRLEGDAFVVFTLHGEREARDDEPVTHLSYYEADALCRFLGGRLPTEAEWEHAVGRSSIEGRFREDGVLRARPAPEQRGPRQLFGDAWEWTASAHAPYPGFTPGAGAIGEYNGKFMVNQLVLRGGSCLTPRQHVRPSYRNFWAPETRFQLTGARLARDVRKAGPA